MTRPPPAPERLYFNEKGEMILAPGGAPPLPAPANKRRGRRRRGRKGAK